MTTPIKADAINKDENNVENVSDDINNTPSWLNNAFVEAIMRRDEENKQLSVIHIDVKMAVPKGENYGSILHRVDVEYRNRPKDKEAKKRSLIVKSFPEGEAMAKWMDDAGAFLREAQMYNVTLPAIHKLMKERMGEDQENLGTKVYVCDRPNTIVLDDLKPLDYKMADRRQGLDLKHGIIALRTLAKLHGLSIVLHAEDPTSMDPYLESMWVERNREMLSSFMVPIFSKLPIEVRSWPGFERFEEKLKTISLEAVDRMMELTKNKPGSPRVLSHGDFWTNNMLFRYDTEGNVEDVKMLDFQISHFGSPALDVIYFLYSSLNQQVLEDHFNQMLEEYHTTLCATMRIVNCDDDLFISMEQLKQEMEDKAFFAVLISGMFCVVLSDPENAPDFSKFTEESVGKMYSGGRFRAVFQRRLTNFECKGLL